MPNPALRLPALAAAIVFCCGASAAPLTIEVGNLQDARGDVYVTIYDSPETWLSADTHRATRRVAVPEDAGDAIAVAFDLPPGRYAFAVHHDVNGNGKMDYRLLRLPKEPYAFSNNLVPKLSRPAFDAAAFDLPDDGIALGVQLL